MEGLAPRRHRQSRRPLSGHRHAGTDAARLAARRRQAHAHVGLRGARDFARLDRGRRLARDLWRSAIHPVAVPGQRRTDGQGAARVGAVRASRRNRRLSSPASDRRYWLWRWHGVARAHPRRRGNSWAESPAARRSRLWPGARTADSSPSARKTARPAYSISPNRRRRRRIHVSEIHRRQANSSSRTGKISAPSSSSSKATAAGLTHPARRCRQSRTARCRDGLDFRGCVAPVAGRRSRRRVAAEFLGHDRKGAAARLDRRGTQSDQGAYRVGDGPKGHCDRSEAIQFSIKAWIASSRACHRAGHFVRSHAPRNDRAGQITYCRSGG